MQSRVGIVFGYIMTCVAILCARSIPSDMLMRACHVYFLVARDMYVSLVVGVYNTTWVVSRS